MNLILICDTSGSMSEGSNHLLTRGMVRGVEQYLRLGYGHADLTLVAWNREAHIIPWSPDDEFPQEMLRSEESANAEALIAFLEKHPGDRVLIVTDGDWPHTDDRALKRWKENLPTDSLRIIKIGIQSNPHWKKTDVFAPEDFFFALDGWLEKEDAHE